MGDLQANHLCFDSDYWDMCVLMDYQFITAFEDVVNLLSHLLCVIHEAIWATVESQL